MTAAVSGEYSFGCTDVLWQIRVDGLWITMPPHRGDRNASTPPFTLTPCRL